MLSKKKCLKKVKEVPTVVEKIIVKEKVREQVPVQQVIWEDRWKDCWSTCSRGNWEYGWKVKNRWIETIVPQLVKVHEDIKDKIVEVPLRNHKGSSN